jgi:hypothetical protein
MAGHDVERVGHANWEMRQRLNTAISGDTYPSGGTCRLAHNLRLGGEEHQHTGNNFPSGSPACRRFFENTGQGESAQGTAWPIHLSTTRSSPGPHLSPNLPSRSLVSQSHLSQRPLLPRHRSPDLPSLSLPSPSLASPSLASPSLPPSRLPSTVISSPG